MAKIRVQDSEEFKSAARNFLIGFWQVPGNKERVGQAMRHSWSQYKRSARYENLRQQLSDAAKGRQDRAG